MSTPVIETERDGETSDFVVIAVAPVPESSDDAIATPALRARDRVRGAVRLLRPKQWVKNAFVVAPLIFSHEFLQPAALIATAVAFAYFCATASATYVLNDIRDRESDRMHPVKRFKRPIAAGLVSLPVAIGMLVALWGVVLTSALWDLRVFAVLAAYSLINVAYSLVLKHHPVVDIFTIAIGFVLRVIAGSFAIGAPISSWMCITVLCLALYLASVKRLQELRGSGSTARATLDRYSTPLVQRYAEMSATGALVFYSMFVLTMETHLAITIPLVIFGLFRYWWVVDHEGAGESPTDALLRDWQLLLTCVAWSGVLIWSFLPLA